MTGWVSQVAFFASTCGIVASAIIIFLSHRSTPRNHLLHLVPISRLDYNTLNGKASSKIQKPHPSIIRITR